MKFKNFVFNGFFYWLAYLRTYSLTYLEYLQVLATTLVSLFFIYMIPIDCKVANFSLYL